MRVWLRNAVTLLNVFGIADCGIIVVSPYDIRALNLFESATAEYGPELPNGSVTGFSITRTSCTRATETLSGRAGLLDASKPRVVLIREDDPECPLTEKIHQARAAGYSAVIIFSTTAYDEEPFNLTRHRDNQTNGLLLPVFTIARRNGALLWEMYSSGGEFDILLISDKALDNELRKFFRLGAIAVLFLGSIFVICQIWSCCLPCRRPSSNAVTLGGRRGIISKLPSRQIHHGSFRSLNTVCSICLDNYGAGDKVRAMEPCGHEFHRDCVDPWLLEKDLTCPICRERIKLKKPELTVICEESVTQAHVPLVHPLPATESQKSATAVIETYL